VQRFDSRVEMADEVDDIEPGERGLRAGHRGEAADRAIDRREAEGGNAAMGERAVEFVDVVHDVFGVGSQIGEIFEPGLARDVVRRFDVNGNE
jgi:hypothetical protein